MNEKMLASLDYTLLANVQLAPNETALLLRAAGDLMLAEVSFMPAATRESVVECFDLLFRDIWKNRDAGDSSVRSVGGLLLATQQGLAETYGTLAHAHEPHPLNPHNERFKKGLGGAYDSDVAMGLWRRYTALVYRRQIGR